MACTKEINEAIKSNKIDLALSMFNDADNLIYERFCGWTWLHVAAKYDRISILDVLLKAGVSLESKDNLGYTPLAQAIIKNHYSFSEKLIHHGANVNSTISSGKSCLQLAIESKSLKSVRLLVENGAKLIENLLEIAIKIESWDIVDYLLTKGITLDLKEKSNLFSRIFSFKINLQDYKKKLEEFLNLKGYFVSKEINQDISFLVRNTNNSWLEVVSLGNGFVDKLGAHRRVELIGLIPNENMYSWICMFLLEIISELQNRVIHDQIILNNLNDSRYPSCLLINDDSIIGDYYLKDKSSVGFYCVIPIFKEEVELINEIGAIEFIERMEANQIGQVIDFSRLNLGRHNK